ncbi:MFS transporter [Streptomyces solicathayae]|uniref:MFS transporter n=1 Tax=Streptomyces solicathayae TaxID=3081768 RepID=A0ABZ0LWB3_9ACTN|nr:MFS transporter [Streptomyces sp. HUAS YS2]WOX23772.1 MFS transporter [Streptomyces sp. HUAS YS2]
MSYREIVTRPVLVWCAVTAGARLPVAMAPLAVVFLVRERPGGYSLGAALAAVYVIGEIVGAPLLGVRLNPVRARPALAFGCGFGALGFAGLGLAPGAHPVFLGGCAFVAGFAPAAVSGAMRALLTEMVPQRAVSQAMSLESMLVFAVWAAAPALVTGLALGVDPTLPLLLQAALMAASVAGLWALPAGWQAEPSEGGGESMTRILARAWPVYAMGAGSLTLLALAELILPALLEQRGIGIGWAGPLLAGFSIASAVGAFVYGLRSRWPGRLPVQSLVLVLSVAALVALTAVLPYTAAIGAALVLAGLLQAPAMLTRNLALREALPPSALAAGYSVMYAAVGAGYAASGSLAGGLLQVVAPSTAILCGVGLTLLLTLIGAAGERRMRRPAAAGAQAGHGGAPTAAGTPAEAVGDAGAAADGGARTP